VNNAISFSSNQQFTYLSTYLPVQVLTSPFR
jgi:hypothetical protein